MEYYRLLYKLFYQLDSVMRSFQQVKTKFKKIIKNFILIFQVAELFKQVLSEPDVKNISSTFIESYDAPLSALFSRAGKYFDRISRTVKDSPDLIFA